MCVGGGVCGGVGGVCVNVPQKVTNMCLIRICHIIRTIDTGGSKEKDIIILYVLNMLLVEGQNSILVTVPLSKTTVICDWSEYL